MCALSLSISHARSDRLRIYRSRKTILGKVPQVGLSSRLATMQLMSKIKVKVTAFSDHTQHAIVQNKSSTIFLLTPNKIWSQRSVRSPTHVQTRDDLLRMPPSGTAFGAAKPARFGLPRRLSRRFSSYMREEWTPPTSRNPTWEPMGEEESM